MSCPQRIRELWTQILLVVAAFSSPPHFFFFFSFFLFFCCRRGNAYWIRQYLQLSPVCDYSLRSMATGCMEAFTESWCILFSSCALPSPLPRITGLHVWDGGWRGWALHWILHSSSNTPPRWLLFKAILFLDQTHLQLENVHWRYMFAVITLWPVSFLVWLRECKNYHGE